MNSTNEGNQKPTGSASVDGGDIFGKLITGALIALLALSLFFGHSRTAYGIASVAPVGARDVTFNIVRGVTFIVGALERHTPWGDDRVPQLDELEDCVEDLDFNAYYYDDIENCGERNSATLPYFGLAEALDDSSIRYRTDDGRVTSVEAMFLDELPEDYLPLAVTIRVVIDDTDNVMVGEARLTGQSIQRAIRGYDDRNDDVELEYELDDETKEFMVRRRDEDIKWTTYAGSGVRIE